ncbi:uncharacterized protein BCR38DRAFT_511578 [Pseudomassariella vexata]|uniref:Uncharacterized protein n=1 Tax=Pseudomassariella vexata TaxID=1141098 RepID=A0A1Y2E3F0_9PEZI|nr:uncharacterized protein BCR38DRAFT_511578 [Pseudomassariella vexata]ORY65957.1 hypothetical protein BCR38DRAFT_511578 [Pseudomassariella vexata]
MDTSNYRLPRRSASHGTLRSSYAHHGRPLHKPLRSVNENSVLLHSPGALESMLKTTTETGDIGIFSIKPSSSSNLGELTPRRNNISRGTGQMLPPVRRSVDDRRKPPSHRDTTSEILSMYGSASQSSVTSTLTPSTDEIGGQRSYSMTTVGSRHLSHHKSNATMQSQASGSNMQRPRSPFPYPTRLKRPGARPSSPAVTENGLVDYSRMVEINRISLRTSHGPYKSSYPQPRRPPPLGLRADANQSTPPLLGQGPPMRRHPGPPSVRTVSAASVASWNAPFRDRLDSNSSRTSSLTSVINMYHRMPSALKNTQLAPPAPPPRYYDYTEEFESKQPRSSTPVQPVAPVPTRAPSAQRPMVLREGSEEQLAAALGVDAESESLQENENRSDSGDTEHIQARKDVGGHGDGDSDQPTTGQGLTQRTPASPPQGIVAVPNSAGRKRTQTRGSDIDLLPSQIGRGSMDTFNPSLDIESREATYSYLSYRATASSKTMSALPGRQVQVQGSGTPTIRSEQGVILKDDVEDESSLERASHASVDRTEVATPIISVQSPSKGGSNSNPADGHSKTLDEKAQGTFVRPLRRGTSTEPLGSMVVDSKPNSNLAAGPSLMGEDLRLKLDAIVENAESRKSSISSNPGENTVHRCSDERGDVNSSPDTTNSLRMKGSENNFNQYRCHRRNQAALNIATKDLPRESSGDFPRLTPSCSETPLISPKPISPARQLKVKNSIPQLMKALPPLPGEPGYVQPSTPPTTGDEDDVAEVLAPFSFASSDTSNVFRGPNKTQFPTNSMCDGGNRLSSLPKKLPKIRLRPKEAIYSRTNPRDSRPWNSDSNYPWCSHSPEIEHESEDGNDNSLASAKRKFRLRGSRSVGGGSPSPTTVRRHPAARGSEIVASLARQQAKDLFSLPSGLSSAFREVSRKLTSSTHHDVGSSIEKPGVASEDPRNAEARQENQGAELEPKKQRILTRVRGRRDWSTTRARKSAGSKRQQRLRKSLSNIGWIIERSPHVRRGQAMPTSVTQLVPDKRQAGLDSVLGTDNIDFDSKQFTVSEGLSPVPPQRARFRRRVRDKVSKWMRRTKETVKAYGKKIHGM